MFLSLCGTISDLLVLFCVLCTCWWVWSFIHEFLFGYIIKVEICMWRLCVVICLTSHPIWSPIVVRSEGAKVVDALWGSIRVFFVFFWRTTYGLIIGVFRRCLHNHLLFKHVYMLHESDYLVSWLLVVLCKQIIEFVSLLLQLYTSLSCC